MYPENSLGDFARRCVADHFGMMSRAMKRLEWMRPDAPVQTPEEYKFRSKLMQRHDNLNAVYDETKFGHIEKGN